MKDLEGWNWVLTSFSMNFIQNASQSNSKSKIANSRNNIYCLLKKHLLQYVTMEPSRHNIEFFKTAMILVHYMLMRSLCKLESG
jgi:hypothetical protein